MPVMTSATLPDLEERIAFFRHRHLNVSSSSSSSSSSSLGSASSGSSDGIAGAAAPVDSPAKSSSSSSSSSSSLGSPSSSSSDGGLGRMPIGGSSSSTGIVRPQRPSINSNSSVVLPQNSSSSSKSSFNSTLGNPVSTGSDGNIPHDPNRGDWVEIIRTEVEETYISDTDTGGKRVVDVDISVETATVHFGGLGQSLDQINLVTEITHGVLDMLDSSEPAAPSSDLMNNWLTILNDVDETVGHAIAACDRLLPRLDNNDRMKALTLQGQLRLLSTRIHTRRKKLPGHLDGAQLHAMKRIMNAAAVRISTVR